MKSKELHKWQRPVRLKLLSPSARRALAIFLQREQSEYGRKVTLGIANTAFGIQSRLKNVLVDYHEFIGFQLLDRIDCKVYAHLEVVRTRPRGRDGGSVLP
jgi:hypothetical protein